eukprot:SAG31_NODE_5_length_43735_cov_42.922266_5_plen_114_part_00
MSSESTPDPPLPFYTPSALEPGAAGPTLAGLLWCDELTAATGDPRYLKALLVAADLYIARPVESARGSSAAACPYPADEDFRTEDMFFHSALLGEERCVKLKQCRSNLDLLAA